MDILSALSEMTPHPQPGGVLHMGFIELITETGIVIKK